MGKKKKTHRVICGFSVKCNDYDNFSREIFIFERFNFFFFQENTMN